MKNEITALNVKKISTRDLRVIVPELVNSLEGCMLWMDNLRTSGDSGYWEWDWDDEYTKARSVLNEFNTKL